MICAAVWMRVRRYEQGVTRPRTNLGNLRKIAIPKPLLKEQLLISQRLDELSHRMDVEISKKKKIELQKSGFMHDLLTGKVPITLDPTAIA
jgi:type I restriction enzyme, S subunit